MAKLHELLAVQENLTGQATKKRTELMATFEKKRHLFEETRKTFTPFGEQSIATVEEQKDLQSTIAKEIEWISQALAKAADVGYQVDLANAEAKADVVTEDDMVLLKDVPGTALLRLAHRITEWKDMIAVIPTLDPAKGFRPDPDRGNDVYKARDVNKQRTLKTKKLYIKYEATPQHPAQTELLDENVPVGTILEQEWSGLITPSKKAALLDRVEILSRAVAKALAKANEHAIDPKDKKIGADLLAFVFEPLKTA